LIELFNKVNIRESCDIITIIIIIIMMLSLVK